MTGYALVPEFFHNVEITKRKNAEVSNFSVFFLHYLSSASQIFLLSKYILLPYATKTSELLSHTK